MRAFEFAANHLPELAHQLQEHAVLTVLALFAATLVALPLGLWLTPRPRAARWVLGAAGVLQTIPSLALLGALIPLLGIGEKPAILALFMYALLPIVRNTYTGVRSVDPAVLDAARGMGMSRKQLLLSVELPLAMPVIFAGLRTATVITVGVATLAALIGAGGLGVYIFRGISLNDSAMMLTGAVPAALLALTLDGVLAWAERRLKTRLVPLLALLVLIVASAPLRAGFLRSHAQPHLKLGMTAEFMERPDGFVGLRDRYGLAVKPVEIEHGLMYRALSSGDVDAVVGYATDGAVASFDLVPLDDDLHYFPPYEAAALVRRDTLARLPELGPALERLGGAIDQAAMARMNAEVEQQKRAPFDVARAYLDSLGLRTDTRRRREPADVVIGSKTFAEQHILAEMFAIVVENETSLSVALKRGLGGTKLCFEALRAGALDLYPEYTGTGLFAILRPDARAKQRLLSHPERVYDHVKRTFAEQFDLVWLDPLGFQNTYAVMVTRERAAASRLERVSQWAARTRSAGTP